MLLSGFLYNSNFMASDKFSISEPKSTGIVSKPDKPELADVVPGLVKWLDNHHYQVVIDRETAAYASGVETIDREQSPKLEFRCWV